MPPEIPDSVPGVEDKQLAAVVSDLPALPNIRAEVADRFSQAIRNLVENRAQQSWVNEGEQNVAVFVMVDRPRQVGENHDAQPFVDPIANNSPLLGHLFFTNQDASAGRVMPMPVKDSNNILEWLEENKLSSLPLVIVYKDSKTMVTRRCGIDDNARNDPIRDRPPTATKAELLEALEYFHSKSLLTPICCLDGVWERGRANEYVPGPTPEKKIQSGLGAALNFWFRGVVRAEHEDSTNIGRIDVRLLVRSNENVPSLKYWAIIELKVVKSYANATKGNTPSKVRDSKNVNSIIEGIQQAWAFKNNRASEIGLLEIFDLRKNKQNNLMKNEKVTTTIEQFAPPPIYNVRPIFGSASEARNAGFCG